MKHLLQGAILVDIDRLLAGTNAFQYMAILHNDRVMSMRDGRRDFGWRIEIRSWESLDTPIARPTRPPFEMLEKLADEIILNVSGIVSVTYTIFPKPSPTIEAV